MIDIVQLDNKKKWYELTKNQDSIPENEWIYSSFQKLSTKKQTILLTINNKKKIKFCPFHINKNKSLKKIYSLSGFSGFNEHLDNEELLLLFNFLRKKNFSEIYLTSNPYIKYSTNDENKQIFELKNKCYFIDLDKDLHLIFNSFKKNIQKKITSNQKEYKIFINEVFSPTELEDLYKKNLKRLSIKSKHFFSLKALNFIINQTHNSCINIASRFNGKLTQLSCFLYSKNYAYYLFSINYGGYEQQSAKHIYEAIKLLKSKKIKFLNLGGEVKSNPGVNFFKLQFNPEVRCVYDFKKKLN